MEALALFAAGRLIYHQAPTRQYRTALEKLARTLPTPLRELLLKSTEGLEARNGDSRALELVARALLERRVLAFEYRSGGSKNWRPKELLVYFLEPTGPTSASTPSATSAPSTRRSTPSSFPECATSASWRRPTRSRRL